MWLWAGVSLAWTSSPVTPSIAAAATDRACTSSPTLVRSVNTGASSAMSDRPSSVFCSVTHEFVRARPRPTTHGHHLAQGAGRFLDHRPPTDGWDGVNVEHAQRSEHERR